MKQLKEMVQKQKKSRHLLLFTSIASGIVIVAQAYFIVSTVDALFLQAATLLEVIPFLLGLLLAFSARASLTYATGRIGLHMAVVAKREFRNNLLLYYRNYPLQASREGLAGKRVSVILDCVDEIDPYFSTYYPQRIVTSIVPLIVLATVFWYNWISATILLVTAPFIPLLMILIGRSSKKKAEEQMEKLTLFSGKFLDILQGLVTLKFFGKAKEQHQEIYDSSIRYREATMEVLKIAFVSSLMLEFISMLGIALIALELGLRLVVFQQLTFFTAFFVLLLAPEFYATFKELGSAFHAGRGSMGAAEKIVDELKQGSKVVEWGELELESKIPPKIALEDVSFRYSETSFSLEGVHATVEPFTNAAIVGKTGAGKTTLLHMLAGLFSPESGKILINDRPLFAYKEESWFDQFSYISQQPFLFSGTIEENILIGMKQGQLSKDEWESVIKKAGLKELIETLDDREKTLVGEGGRGLSGGEKQRIALARALVKKPSVIFFDEPTAGLDLRTEHVLQQSLEELAKTATVITVAHRLHTIQHADQLLFLEEGRLIATGTHQKLLNSCATYRNMFEIQRNGKEATG
ncbi:thiol reductant ABC exporter subunit CydD [Anaerobacillus alkaliphilus]|uniref:Thiol reductant ABC exporter subunit CydD n=1 Tax=Anaerobacillus alkaliphilus TaxID=1548597 RepID=A0A4Q0VNB6_9BACI|nr:thiol reductant ABC exporter subunit CydD [Anaerobacillus alkaliphilus]RXI97892.1 thiol reductant ABC exporter subunit CydD [Anaerobacillus alkaliphilus]